MEIAWNADMTAYVAALPVPYMIKHINAHAHINANAHITILGEMVMMLMVNGQKVCLKIIRCL